MPRPESLAEFLAPPSLAEWNAALRAGWPGPDGSSASTDTIMGVRIGTTSADHQDARLPANAHDWRYRLGRRYRLPETWREQADIAYREGCRHECRYLPDPYYQIAAFRCWVRYVALRVGARWAWTAKAKARRANWTGEAGG